MLQLEEIKLYLPKYLSTQHTNILIAELKKFPDNIDSRLYISATGLTEKILQGDGLISVPGINLPDGTIRQTPAMVVSNSCDNDPSNARYFAANLLYCPILKLSKYQRQLIDAGIEPRVVDSHIGAVKKQEIAQVFYLPKGSGLDEERIIFFNSINSCDADHVYGDFSAAKRLFRLSDYGIYLFIFKLSVYFTRITEGIERE